MTTVGTACKNNSPSWWSSSIAYLREEAARPKNSARPSEGAPRLCGLRRALDKRRKFIASAPGSVNDRLGDVPCEKAEAGRRGRKEAGRQGGRGGKGGRGSKRGK